MTEESGNINPPWEKFLGPFVNRTVKDLTFIAVVLLIYVLRSLIIVLSKCNIIIARNAKLRIHLFKKLINSSFLI